MYLTHIDADGNDSPPILIEDSTAANRAVNLPEFVNIAPDAVLDMTSPASELYRLIDEAGSLQDAGNKDEAFETWKKAIAMDPEDARVNNGMGMALTDAGRLKEAVFYLKKATQANSNFLQAFYALGSVEMREHQVEDAIDAWQNAVRIYPGFFQAHEGLGFAYYMQGKYRESLAQLRLALDGEPDRVSVLKLAASLMATSADASLRNGPEAVILAERARDLTQSQDISVLDTLSSSYAENGRFDQAKEAVNQALALSEKQGNADLAAQLKAHQARYEANQPLREPDDHGIL
jgi:tetratricopeptide (TPR) repeat protein